MVVLKRSRVVAVCLAAAALNVSCGGGGDGGTGPTLSVPTSIQAVTATQQQAAVNALVAEPPGVRVRDQNGAPMAGITVAFAVSAGNGQIDPASVPTDADGTARLDSWRLGTAPGANTVTATVTGLPPVAFNATGSQVVASIVALQPTSQEALAGGTAPVPPGALVRDLAGNPIAGVTVSFVVQSGNGTITPNSVATNAEGIARLTSWTLGPNPGGNTVTASVPGRAPVIFSANGLGELPAPASVQPISSTSQDNVLLGTVVPEPPAVIVRDQNGAPMAGITVAFAVTQGGGSITPASVVTAADGVAQVTSWTVGPNTGQNTATATVAGLPAVTFNATGAGCPAPTPIAVGQTVNGNLGSSTCRLSDNAFVEYYTFTLTAADTIRITLTSSAFDPYLLLLRPNGKPVAENDDIDSPSNINSQLRAILVPGTYIIAATSFAPGETGAFSLQVQTANAAVTGGVELFLTRGITTAQTLSNTDFDDRGFWTDLFALYLDAGETVSIGMNSTALDATLTLFRLEGDGSFSVVAFNDDKAPGTDDAEIVYTATQGAYHFISASSGVPGQTGAYSLVVP